ncbi:MAG: hypothetical protein R2880_19445 [Deinococcales bacterium]
MSKTTPESDKRFDSIAFIDALQQLRDAAKHDPDIQSLTQTELDELIADARKQVNREFLTKWQQIHLLPDS